MDYTKNISIKLTKGEAKKFYDLCDFYSLPKWTTARLLVYIAKPWKTRAMVWAGFDLQSPRIAKLKMAYGEALTMNLALALAEEAHKRFFGATEIDASKKIEDLARVLGCPTTNEVFEFLVNWAYRFDNGLKPAIARDSINLHYVIPEKCNDSTAALKTSIEVEHAKRQAGKKAMRTKI